MDEVKHIRYAQAVQARLGQLNQRFDSVTHPLVPPDTQSLQAAAGEDMGQPTIVTRTPQRGLLGAGRTIIRADSRGLPAWIPLDGTWGRVKMSFVCPIREDSCYSAYCGQSIAAIPSTSSSQSRSNRLSTTMSVLAGNAPEKNALRTSTTAG